MTEGISAAADSVAPGRTTALTPGERRLAVIAFAIVGVVMVAFTLAANNFLSAVHSASDEASYLTYAHNIVEGGYAVAGQQHEGLYLWHTPGLPLLIAPLVWLRVPIEVIRLIGPLCLIASGVLLMVILRRFVRPRVAIAAGLLLCLYPPFWRLLPQLFAEPPALLLGLAGFEALIRYAERRRIGWAMTAGLAFGVMIMFRPEYGYMALAVLILAVLAFARPRWRAVARAGRRELRCGHGGLPAVAGLHVLQDPHAALLDRGLGRVAVLDEQPQPRRDGQLAEGRRGLHRPQPGPAPSPLSPCRGDAPAPGQP